MALPRAGFGLEAAYRIGLLAKGLLGLAQLVGGVALWLAPQDGLPRVIDWLTRAELAQDPGDFIVTHLRDWATNLSIASEHFYAFYLLGHGALNFGVVAALFLRLRGAYHVSMAVLVAFVLYQCYGYLRSGDPALLVLTGIDLVVILLVFFERRASQGRA